MEVDYLNLVLNRIKRSDDVIKINWNQNDNQEKFDSNATSEGGAIILLQTLLVLLVIIGIFAIIFILQKCCEYNNNDDDNTTSPIRNNVPSMRRNSRVQRSNGSNYCSHVYCNRLRLANPSAACRFERDDLNNVPPTYADSTQNLHVTIGSNSGISSLHNECTTLTPPPTYEDALAKTFSASTSVLWEHNTPTVDYHTSTNSNSHHVSHDTGGGSHDSGRDGSHDSVGGRDSGGGGDSGGGDGGGGGSDD